MRQRKQLATVIAEIIINDQLDDVDQEIIDDYKALNEKCDRIISKISQRKKVKP